MNFHVNLEADKDCCVYIFLLLCHPPATLLAAGLHFLEVQSQILIARSLKVK